jgi:hypothetical protein
MGNQEYPAPSLIAESLDAKLARFKLTFALDTA